MQNCKNDILPTHIPSLTVVFLEGIESPSCSYKKLQKMRYRRTYILNKLCISFNKSMV